MHYIPERADPDHPDNKMRAKLAMLEGIDPQDVELDPPPTESELARSAARLADYALQAGDLATAHGWLRHACRHAAKAQRHGFIRGFFRD